MNEENEGNPIADADTVEGSIDGVMIEGII